MSKQTTVKVTCDFCKAPIAEENYIDASVYGKDFHVTCVQDMNGFGMLCALELDDIQYAKSGDKVIYYYPNGEHRG